MPAQVFGAPAAAVQLYIAFYGAAPSNPIYENLVGVAGASSSLSLALTIGNEFRTVSDADLATRVLTNIGITATTIPAASYTALQTAMAQAFAAFPTQRGIVVSNALNILRGLETDATFGTVAQVFNQSVANAYVYASNPANTQTQTLGTITTTSPLTVNSGDIVTGTSGNDSINGNLFFNTPSGTFFQTLNTGDSVNGGAGTDMLNVGFNNGAPQTINATLTSIEGLSVNATAGGTTSIDMTNGTGLSSVSISNGSAGGDITLTSVGSLISTVSLNTTAAGLTVGSTAATVAGTADAVAVNLSQAGTSAVPITLSMTGYETFNIASNGPAANGVTLGYSAGATATLTGTQSLTLSTGTSTNAITVNGAGMTGTGALTVTASGGVNAVNVTGTANGDTVSFGGNYLTSDVYAGGAGTDTISLNEAQVATITANQTNLSALEVVALATATTATTYTPAAFGGATTLALGTGIGSANAITVNYGAGTGGLTMTSTNQGGAMTLNSSGSATTDVLNLSSTATSTAVGNLTQGAVNSTGFETINLASGGALGQTNTFGNITMAASAATEVLNVTGARDVTLGMVTADQINASAATGSVIMTAASASAGFSGGVAVTTNGVQITGGGAADTLFGSDGADQIVGGAGNDRIMFGTGASQADIVTGGAGADTFRFTAATQSAGTAQVVKITDFVAGSDKIGLFGLGITSISGVSSATIATADTLALVYAGAGTGTAGGAATPIARLLTVSGGLQAGTFLVIDTNNNGAFTDATDMLINVTGVTGTIGTGDFSFT